MIRRNPKIIFTGLVIFTTCLIVAYFGQATVSAWTSSGYFNDKSFNSYYGSGNQVIQGGIPNSVTDKVTFISFVLEQYNDWSAKYRDCSSLPAGDPDNRAEIKEKNNCIGAAYIIQTMRGGTDKGFPDIADINDWMARVNSSKVIYENESTYTSTINTKIGFSSEDVLDPYDVFEYSVDSSDSESIVFKDSSGEILYVVRRACGNPLGSLPGLLSDTFDLTPSVNLTMSSGEVGSSFNVNRSVNNTGNASSSGTVWESTKIILKKGVSATNTSGGNSDSSACTFYGISAPDCTTPRNGTYDFPVGNKVFSAYPDTVDDYEAGTHICYALSVKSRSDASGQWAHSALSCLVIGKKPKIQVLGGDLVVGSKIQTSASTKTIAAVSRTFGSWAEYGIFAVGTVSNMASGSAFAGSGLMGSTVCGYSVLSFANTPSGGTACTGAANSIGNYTNARSDSDFTTSFPGGDALPDASGVPSNWGSGTYTAGDLTLNASNLPAGKSIIIKATGTVTINGNQTYSNGPYTNISGLPQLVIIANKIIINGSVTNIDAWLIAKNGAGTGSIQTCDIIGNDVSKCSSKLTVNGPVATDKLYLYRTAGSGAGAGISDPAEVFNLRADVYLWSYSRASSSSRVQTVYTTELPPRF